MSDELMAIAAAFDDVLAASLPLESLLEGAAADNPVALESRSALTEMGIHSIALPDDFGGFGARPDWIAAIMQKAGRRLLPQVLRDEALLLVPLLAEAARADDAQAETWLEGLQQGSLAGSAGAVVVGPDLERVTANGDEFACDAVPVWIAPGAVAIGLITPDGGWLFDTADPRVHLEAVHGIDPGQGAARLTVDQDRVVAARRSDPDTAARILRVWELGLLAEAVGCADWVTEKASNYAVERHQFDRPIATFQAVAHLLADMKQKTELGRSVLARLVSLMQSEATAATTDLMTAGRLWIPRAAREVCEMGIQVLGGMGFTWEVGLHLWYRRALCIQALLGGAAGAAAAAGAHFTQQTRDAASLIEEGRHA